MKILILGFTQPDGIVAEVTRESAVLPTQTHRFAWNLVEALKGADARVALLSTLPVPNFPEYRRVLVRSSRFEAREVPGMSMGFINLLLLKHLSRTFQCVSHGKRFVDHVQPSVVLVHGVHTPFLRFARTLQHRGISVVAVLTDPPGVVRPRDRGMVRLLKRLDRRAVTRALTGFDGVLALSRELAEDFAPGVPALVFPGFAPVLTPASKEDRGTGGCVVAYAGGLSRDYGVANLVEAVRGLDDTEVTLELYGRGELESWILDQAALDSRIQYRGALPPDELHDALRRATVLVNPRTLDGEHVIHVFPSKLLEYPMLGVPTVTTPLPGIPRELESAYVITADDSPGHLRSGIQEVISWTDSVRDDFTRNSRELLAGHLAPPNVGQEIVGFLSGLRRS